MNLNYVGSVAERFMKFRSTLKTEESVDLNIFNAVSIYVPKSLAQANLASGSYDPSGVTETTYAVITVTVDNYTQVFADGSALLTQWLPVFNDGTNSAVTLYVVVFDDTDFSPVTTSGAITWSPLTKAFKELYFISFFKTMFSEHYDGTKVEGSDANYDDSNYFDLALCLAYQCETEPTLSFDLIETKVTVFAEGGNDTNICKVMSHTKGAETTHCTTFVSSTKQDRAEYFWGYLNLIGFTHSNLIVHNGSIMTPIVLGKWFEERNNSGEFVGNKLAKIRLSGNKVKPTGLASPLNSDINLNLGSYIYEKLDKKNVGYFISISDGSQNNAELITAKSGSGFPIPAYMISKFIDYSASQALAEYATATTSLTNPVLANEKTYAYIQSLLLSCIQKFSGTGRITNIALNFPAYADAKKGQTFEGTAVWSAIYVDDLEGVNISGSISF